MPTVWAGSSLGMGLQSASDTLASMEQTKQQRKRLAQQDRALDLQGGAFDLDKKREGRLASQGEEDLRLRRDASARVADEIKRARETAAADSEAFSLMTQAELAKLGGNPEHAPLAEAAALAKAGKVSQQTAGVILGAARSAVQYQTFLRGLEATQAKLASQIEGTALTVAPDGSAQKTPGDDALSQQMMDIVERMGKIGELVDPMDEDSMRRGAQALAKLEEEFDNLREKRISADAEYAARVALAEEVAEKKKIAPGDLKNQERLAGIGSRLRRGKETGGDIAGIYKEYQEVLADMAGFGATRKVFGKPFTDTPGYLKTGKPVTPQAWNALDPLVEGGPPLARLGQKLLGFQELGMQSPHPADVVLRALEAQGDEVAAEIAAAEEKLGVVGEDKAKLIRDAATARMERLLRDHGMKDMHKNGLVRIMAAALGNGEPMEVVQQMAQQPLWQRTAKVIQQAIAAGQPMDEADILAALAATQAGMEKEAQSAAQSKVGNPREREEKAWGAEVPLDKSPLKKKAAEYRKNLPRK